MSDARWPVATPTLAMGTWALGGYGWGDINWEKADSAVKTAFEHGIEVFDTAPVYGFGKAETTLAKALGSHVDDAVIATKVGMHWTTDGQPVRDCSPDRIRESVAGSRERLGLETIPLVQLHWWDGVTPIEKVVSTLQGLQDSGQIEAYGACNLDAEKLDHWTSHGPIQSIQGPGSLLRAKEAKDLATWSHSHGATSLAYDVLAKGLLSGKYTEVPQFPPDDVRSNDPQFIPPAIEQTLDRINESRKIADELNCTLSQLAIAWVMAIGVDCPVVGSRDPSQVEENLEALDVRIDEENLDKLNGTWEV